VNNRQKVVLIAALVIVVLMLLFPPWFVEWEGEYKRLVSYRGYHFVGSPPCCSPRIDVPRWVGAMSVICFMALLAYLELKPES
jgi:hypothetical protein